MDRVITIPRNEDGSVKVLEHDPEFLALLSDTEKPPNVVRIKVMIGPDEFAILMPVTDAQREDPSFEKMITAYAQNFHF